jgi:hypothetical protein
MTSRLGSPGFELLFAVTVLDLGIPLQGRSPPRSIRSLNASPADLDVVATSAEFLEADVTLARTVLDRGCERAIVASHFLVLFFEVKVLNGLAVKHHFQALTFEANLALVPLRWLVDLLRWRNGAVDAARQFGIFGFRVVTEVGHLELDAIEGGVALHGRTKREATVARFAKLELVLEDEIRILQLTHQPRATRFAAL